MPNNILKVIQINSQHKKTAAQVIIDMIISENIDIALIQEPFISTFHNKIPGLPTQFIQYSSQKPKTTTTAIIIKKSIRHWHLDEFSDDFTQTIKLSGDDNLVLSSAYCKRSENAIPKSIAKILEEISHHSIIIGADVNCHSVMVGYQKSDSRASEWEEFMVSNRLVIANDSKSHTFENSRKQKSTIDWTISNTRASDAITNWKVDYDATLLSDHYSIRFDIETNDLQLNLKRNFNKVNWNEFNDQLRKNLTHRNWNQMGVEELAKFAVTSISDTIDTCVPMKKQCKSYKNEWWNDNLQTIKTALKRAKRKHSLEYLKLKEKYEKAIIEAKKLNFGNFVSNVQTADDAYIRYKIFCKKNQDRATIKEIINKEGKVTEGPIETYEALLDINFPGKETLSKGHEILEQAINNKIDRWQPSDFVEITDSEIIRALRSLKMKKSCGFDNIPSVVYKECSNTLLPLLKKLFNESLLQSHFPEIWKTAVVIFLKKPDKPDASDAKSYRPISLLPVISKILEKIVNSRLKWHSEKNKIIDPRQFGFQASTSSEHAAFNLANKIFSTFKKRKEMIAVFLDVKNAFPSTWHSGILIKMIRGVLPNYLIKWTKSYLQDRIAMVQIGEHTIKQQLTRGTPQGAVLSPWLWNIFINDLFKTVEDSGIQIQCFADDIVMYQEIKSKNNVAKMQKALKVIEKWGEKWNVAFAANKTKAIHFTRLRKPSTLPALHFNGSVIEYVENHRYVGVDFDCKLKWRHHVYRVCAKATSMMIKLNAISSKKFGIPAKSHKFIYERAILPIITYASSVWGQATETKYILKQLQKVHRLAALGITGCFRTTSTVALLALSRLQPIENIIQERIGITYFSIQRNEYLSLQRLNFSETIEEHLKTVSNESPILFAQRMCPAESNNMRKLRPIDSFPHPSAIRPIKVSILDREEAIQNASSNKSKMSIFTDASKTLDGEVGISAIVYLSSQLTPILSIQERLNKMESVFFGELAAINMAMKESFVLTEGIEVINIYTDSQAAIKALENVYNRTPIVYEINKTLVQYEENNITVNFNWVPGHHAVEGNEKADELARLASSNNELKTTNRIWSKTKLKNAIKDLHWDLWQREWDSAITGRFTHSLFPKVEKIPRTDRQEISYYDRKLLNRVRSGHFPTKSYLYKFKKTANTNCRYGCKTIEDLEHILTKCPRFSSIRLHDYRLKGMSFEPTIKELLTRDYLLPPTIKICKMLLNDSEEGGTQS